jgi:NADPH:quinone reductase-like Zn-dependent oxidoreductase
MKALALKGPGGVEMLEWVELPRPVPGSGEVVVAVKAIGINPIDVKTRKGIGLYPRLTAESPIIIGWDVCGIIVEKGADVSEFQVGDEVFGMVNFPGHGKAYAEYVACRAEHLAHKPAPISYAQAAATCLAALTAWQALTLFANVNSNTRILIHAAAGGVGHFAVQMARYMGAYVVGTCSQANMDFVLSLGAHEVIDYTHVPFESKIKDIDMVIDGVGGEYIDRSLKVLKKGGIYICLPSNNSQGVTEKSGSAGVNGHTMLVQSNGNDMKTLARLLENKHIVPHISHQFSFENIPLSHQQIETGRTVGKIVVVL